MKQIILVLLLMALFTGAVSSQNTNIPVDENTGLITWQDVIQENGSPLVLYNRCIEWINSLYKNPQEVTKVRDPEGGRIVIHHSFRMVDVQPDGSEINSNTIVNYLLRLEFRENRYRYTFTEFTMKALSKYPLERWLDTNDPSYFPVYEQYLVQVQQSVEKIVESMREGMKEKIIVEDEW